jgi:putative ABC transport system permease protein
VEAVRDVAAATANPEHPDEVQVSRPSDALEARAAADETLTALLLGLGAVSLVVGGLGIATVMVIAVLERRGEIGLRRALGATRRHVLVQFLLESLYLAGLGGIVGALAGGAVVVAYASSRGWTADIPPLGVAGGLGAALLIGALAGLYPALRAARQQPAQALIST